jgi:acetyl esterase/lipase
MDIVKLRGKLVESETTPGTPIQLSSQSSACVVVLHGLWEIGVMIKIEIFLVGALFATGALHAQTTTWQPSPGHTQIALWPGKVPDARPAAAPESFATAENLVAGKPWTYISNVAQPTMTVYSPQANNTRAAVLVFPGGGYKILAIDLEGTEVCDWLTSKGITCVLLKYRVPDSGPHWEDKCDCQVTPEVPAALQDAQRALGLIRLHATEWHIDPDRIGVLGFSAGGHLVADISNHFQHRAYWPVDAADKESCRPDFAIALYPGHLSVAPHPRVLTPTLRVTRDTPPTFLIQAEDDPVDSIRNSLVYFAALKQANVPVEMHIYAHGGHAFGLRPTAMPITRWPQLFEAWLGTIGMSSE